MPADNHSNEIRVNERDAYYAGDLYVRWGDDGPIRLEWEAYEGGAASIHLRDLDEVRDLGDALTRVLQGAKPVRDHSFLPARDSPHECCYCDSPREAHARSDDA